MQTNRRSFLARAAAVAAVAPLVGVTADSVQAKTVLIPQPLPEGTVIDITGMRNTAFIGSTHHIKANANGIGFFGATPVPVEEFDAMYRDAIAQARADSPWGPLYSTNELKHLKAMIAQARADGYNRGREVEMARQESRQEQEELDALERATSEWLVKGHNRGGEAGGLTDA